MNDKKDSNIVDIENVPQEKRKKFIDAINEYEQMEGTMAPYIKGRQIKRYSPKERWITHR